MATNRARLQDMDAATAAGAVDLMLAACDLPLPWFLSCPPAPVFDRARGL